MPYISSSSSAYKPASSSSDYLSRPPPPIYRSTSSNLTNYSPYYSPSSTEGSLRRSSYDPYANEVSHRHRLSSYDNVPASSRSAPRYSTDYTPTSTSLSRGLLSNSASNLYDDSPRQRSTDRGTASSRDSLPPVDLEHRNQRHERTLSGGGEREDTATMESPYRRLMRSREEESAASSRVATPSGGPVAEVLAAEGKRAVCHHFLEKFKSASTVVRSESVQEKFEEYFLRGIRREESNVVLP